MQARCLCLEEDGAPDPPASQLHELVKTAAIQLSVRGKHQTTAAADQPKLALEHIELGSDSYMDIVACLRTTGRTPRSSADVEQALNGDVLGTVPRNQTATEKTQE